MTNVAYNVTTHPEYITRNHVQQIAEINLLFYQHNVTMAA